jgi:RNA polymerase sigma-70 factor (ECF subfamily)
VFDAGEVYRALAPAVLGYLRAQGAPEAEDLLGEVFVQVARDLPRFKGDQDALRRWVFAIAHNRLVDAGRRRARSLPTTRPLVAPDVPVAPSPDPRDPELVKALATLTDEQREVVVLRFVADLPLHEVARMTRRTVEAVKALQHRALQALARQLEP